jgi:hypothetical protein
MLVVRHVITARPTLKMAVDGGVGGVKCLDIKRARPAGYLDMKNTPNMTNPVEYLITAEMLKIPNVENPVNYAS